MNPDLRAPPLCPALAREIEIRGGLDAAIQALASDGSALLPALLAHRASLEEASEPALRLRRLRRGAADLDARAEALWREAAEDAGRAAARRLRGEPALAETFERRAAAAETLAADLEAQAFALRVEAARLESQQARHEDLMRVLRELAA